MPCPLTFRLFLFFFSPSLLYVRSESAFADAICIRTDSKIFMLRILSLFLPIIIIMVYVYMSVAVAQWSGNAEEGIHSFFFCHLIWIFFRGKYAMYRNAFYRSREIYWVLAIAENSSLENQNGKCWRANAAAVVVVPVFYFIFFFFDNFSMNMSTARKKKIEYNADTIISIAVNSLPIWWSQHFFTHTNLHLILKFAHNEPWKRIKRKTQ